MSDSAGAFDAHRPPSRELAEDCVHCGFCLPACPTYALWGREADSPRGRIYLIRAALDGRTTLSPTFQQHFDTCLGCMACLTACPSGVQYDQLVEATRPQIERHVARSFADRWYRRLLFALFPRPDRLRWLKAPLAIYQRTGLQRLVRASGLLKLLPARLAALERLTPPSTAADDTLPRRIEGTTPVRRRVGMLTGCVQRVFFSQVNAATARVLAAEGCEVHVPEQGCCGALLLHSGQESDAADAARRLVDAFERVPDLDHIVINAAGCGSAMKTYGSLLRDDPVYAEKARSFAAKCIDIAELLAMLEPRAVRQPIAARVAYHDACHLQHAQRVKAQPRQVLKTIPGVELREIAESDLCCGSAGVYNLLEPDAAAALRDRKVGHLLRTDAEIVVSSNPGCLLQLASGLEAAGRPIRTMHLVELLDASMRGSG